jgi:pimeloyl-ACP methyl ester carboxylesterase
MPMIHANGIDICCEEDGSRHQPSVLLIHGIGCQLVQWPHSLIAGLVNAGFHVLRMDNRDMGLSQQMPECGQVDLMALMMAISSGERPRVPYALKDMADDAAALIERVGKSSAHIVGVSMGGMIAQRMAIHHPDRVASLTSVMSSSGARGLPPPDPAAIASITAVPVGLTREQTIEQLRQSWNLIGGPHFISTEVGLGRLTELAYDRGRNPAGYLRQMAAIISDVDRADALAGIKAPTLVLHGDADLLAPLCCGEDTARRIPGARFEELPAMGHDLPEPLMPRMLETLLAHFRAATSNIARPR